MNKENLETLKELLDVLLEAALWQDNKMKILDESINPASESSVVHLAREAINFINEKTK